MVLCVLLQIESSGGKDLRHGDGGLAVGPYQTWRVAVDEANRVEKIQSKREGRTPRKWKYSDRTDLGKSREICETTMRWHYKRGVTDPITLACKWNTPYGKIDPRYLDKVKKAVKKYKTRH